MITARRIDIVDTTAAGDTFGANALEIVKGNFDRYGSPESYCSCCKDDSQKESTNLKSLGE